MGQLFDGKYGPVIGIGPFYVANLDTALTNTDLLLANITAETLTPGMPSAGTATFSVHSAGTELVNGPTAVIDSVTNTLESSGLAASARALTFAKGARLGISATTTTNLAATTVDYRVTLWVRFDPDGAAGA